MRKGKDNPSPLAPRPKEGLQVKAGLLEAAMAPQTLRAYRAWMRRYQSFCGEAHLDPFSLAAIGAWLEVLADRHKVSSIEQALAALRLFFRLSGKPSPTKTEPVRLLMMAIRRRLGSAKRQVRPLTFDLLERGQWDAGAKGIRDRAMLMLGFGAALRVSELVALDLCDLEFVAEGLVINIRKSKTDQAGRGRQVAIPYADRPENCIVRAVQAYLEVRGRNEGALFYTLHKGRFTGRRIDPSAVRAVVKDFADRLGLDWRAYSTHSLRAGMATTAALHGATEAEIATQTGHKSLEVVREYIRRGSLFQRNPTTRFLKNG